MATQLFEEYALPSSDEEEEGVSDEEQAQRPRKILINLDNRQLNEAMFDAGDERALYTMRMDAVPGGDLYVASDIQLICRLALKLFKRLKFSPQNARGWRIELITRDLTQFKDNVKRAVTDKAKKKAEDALNEAMNDSKPRIISETGIASPKRTGATINPTSTMDDILDSLGYYGAGKFGSLDVRIYQEYYRVLAAWPLDERLILRFLYEQDESNTLEALDARRDEQGYHSAASWHLLHSNITQHMAPIFHKLHLFQSSRERFALHIDEMHMNNDSMDLYFNDEMHLAYDDALGHVRVKHADPATRPERHHVELWMYILHALRVKCQESAQTTNENREAIRYMTTLLVLSQSLFADAQGRAFFPVMARTHISRDERTMLDSLLTTSKSELVTAREELWFLIDGHEYSIRNLLARQDLKVLAGVFGFVDIEAPILAEIKAVSAHAHLFPLIVLEMVDDTTPETNQIMPLVVYPYKTSVGSTLSQRNIDFQKRAVWLLKYLAKHEMPLAGRMRIVAADLIGKADHIHPLVDLSRDFPEYNIEGVMPSHGNQIQFTRDLTFDQIILLPWITMRAQYPEMTLVDFIRHGFCDRYLTLMASGAIDPSNEEIWAMVLVRAYPLWASRQRGAPVGERATLLIEYTKAVRERYLAQRKHVRYLPRNMQALLRAIIDTERNQLSDTRLTAELTQTVEVFWLGFESDIQGRLMNYYEVQREEIKVFMRTLRIVCEQTRPLVIERLEAAIQTIPMAQNQYRWLIDYDANSRDLDMRSQRNDWERLRTYMPGKTNIAWAFQFSSFLTNELLSESKNTWLKSSLGLPELISTIKWPAMGVPGLTKPLWHLMLPFKSQREVRKERDEAEEAISNATTPQEMWDQFIDPARMQTVLDQHMLLIYPQNYYILFLIANGLFEKAADAIKIVESLPLSPSQQKWTLFRADVTDATLTAIGLSEHIEDVIMSAFVVGLGVREHLQPGTLARIVEIYSTHDFLRFMMFSSRARPFRFRPGLLSFTEAARIGNVDLLNLLYYGVNNMTSKTLVEDRLRSLSAHIKKTMLPECYYTLPPPYRLLTPLNLLHVHQHVNEMMTTTAAGASVAQYDSRLWDFFQAIEQEFHERSLSIDIPSRFSKHYERLLSTPTEAATSKPRRLQRLTLSTLVASMVREEKHVHPLFYGASSDAFDMEAINDHVFHDQPHFIPRVALEADDYEEEEDAATAEAPPADEAQTLDAQLVRLVSQMTTPLDIDLLVASHRRMWQNLYVAAVKRAARDKIPSHVTSIQMDQPDALFGLGGEENEEGGQLNEDLEMLAQSASVLEQRIHAEAQVNRDVLVVFGADVPGHEESDVEHEMELDMPDLQILPGIESLQHDDDETTTPLPPLHPPQPQKKRKLPDFEAYRKHKLEKKKKKKKTEQEAAAAAVASFLEVEEEEAELSSEDEEGSPFSLSEQFEESFSDEMYEWPQEARELVEELNKRGRLATFGTINAQNDKWYSDIVSNKESVANVLLTESSILFNGSVQRNLRSLLSVLVIPIALGLPALRVQALITGIASLLDKDDDAVLSDIDSLIRDKFNLHPGSSSVDPTMLHFGRFELGSSIWRALAVGLFMLSKERTQLPSILGGLCKTLMATLLTIDRPSNENASLLSNSDRETWLAEQMALLSPSKGETIDTTIRLPSVRDTKTLVSTLFPRPVKARAVVNVDSDDEEGANEGNVINTIRRIRDFTGRTIRTAQHQAGGLLDTINKSVATFASDFFFEYSPDPVSTRFEEKAPLFIGQSQLVGRDAKAWPDGELIKTLSAHCDKARLYGVGSKIVRDLLNSYFEPPSSSSSANHSVDHLVLDVILQQHRPSISLWLQFVHNFACADDNAKQRERRERIFAHLFKFTTVDAKTKKTQVISRLLTWVDVSKREFMDNNVIYNSGVLTLLFGSHRGDARTSGSSINPRDDALSSLVELIRHVYMREKTPEK